MKIYAMSDIHGCLEAFYEALVPVLEHLDEPDVKLVLLGDNIHGGENSREVIKKIISLQRKYGSEKVIALLGNHEEFVMNGYSSIDSIEPTCADENDLEEERYIRWFFELPRYYVEGSTIFVHAGIDEDAGDMWQWGTPEAYFTQKFPADTGKIEGLSKKVVAGHVSTSQISGDPRFHGIYYDGASHYYIDGSVLESGEIPVLMVDTKTDKYYQVTENGLLPILPYQEED